MQCGLHEAGARPMERGEKSGRRLYVYRAGASAVLQ